MRIHILLTWITLMLSSILTTAYAQKRKTIKIEGHVRESLMNARLQGAKVVVTDSTGAVIDSVKADGMTYYGNQRMEMARFRLTLPHKKATYTLEVSYPGYETGYTVLTLNDLGSRESERSIPDIILKREPKMIGEVTVTATMVKFFNKGDTIVYNADAFQLAEGSMLDALIEQMPGVELKDDGRIFVNGKFVESLLLNGKEFMGNNNQLMLENLGAYTVKNVSVYEKAGDRSEFLGRDAGDNKFVMDVKLKKEYANGYVANIEVGYGTSGRYMGRIFGLKYNPTSQFMLFGNINNLNDKRTPGRNSTWSPDDMQSGVRREKLAGTEYSVWSPDNAWRFQGNTTLKYSSSDDEIFSDEENFLPGGDTYSYSFKSQRTRNINVNSYNRYMRTMKNVMITGELNGMYMDMNSRNSITSATFNEEQENVTREMIENIYNTTSKPLSNLVNRNLQIDSTAGKIYNIHGIVSSSYRIPKSSDELFVVADIEYENQTPKRFNDQIINYGENIMPSHRVSQYTKNNPAHNFTVKGELNYTYDLSDRGYIQPIYEYTHSHIVKNSYLYALDRLADNGVFGVLPSNYESAYDIDNSHEGVNKLDRHSIGLRSTFTGNNWTLNLGPTLIINRQSLDYRQAGQRFFKTRTSMNYGDIWTTFKIFGGKTTGRGLMKQAERMLTLKFRSKSKLPELEHMIDLPITSDPLNIYLGAEDLKNEQEWSWELRLDLKPKLKKIMESVVLDYNLTHNALVRGYTYNSETGVRTIRSYNTSGNWDMGAANIFSANLDRSGKVTLSSNTGVRYGHVTDMIGVDVETPSPYTVKNLLLNENLKLSWNVISGLNIGGKVDLQWRETHSEQKGFNNIHALTANYGVTATARLPLNFSVSTDMTLFTRHGYSMSSLNTKDWVWNTRLSYSADKGRWLFMLDGFDLLHQLSSVNYAVTAQGRTITYTNVLPRFFMFHVQYKLNLTPKRK